MANRLKVTTSPCDGVVPEVGVVDGDSGVVAAGKTRSWAVLLLLSLLSGLAGLNSIARDSSGDPFNVCSTTHTMYKYVILVTGNILLVLIVRALVLLLLLLSSVSTCEHKLVQFSLL